MRAQTEQERKRASEGIAAPPGRWPLTPAKAPFRPALRGGLVAAAALAVLLAALVGWIARSVSTPGAPPASPAPRTATAGPVTLGVDGAWSPVRAVKGVPGLDAESTAAFTIASGLRAYAIATVAPATDATLLPATLRDLLPSELGKPKPAKLLGLSAWHYAERQISGGRRMEVTVVPTTAGVLAVACVAPEESWVAALGCAAGVRGLDLRDAAWVAPGPDVLVRARLGTAVRRLDARRVTLRAKLRAAKTPRAQARFAARLSRTYAAAAATLAPVAPEKGPAVRAIAALRASAAAHGRLSVAAANRRPGRYRQAKRDVQRGDAALKRALADLR